MKKNASDLSFGNISTIKNVADRSIDKSITKTSLFNDDVLNKSLMNIIDDEFSELKDDFAESFSKNRDEKENFLLKKMKTKIF